MKLLQDWEILDFSDWNGGGARALDRYKSYVRDKVALKLLPTWNSAALRHSSRIPYLLLEQEPGHILDLKDLALSDQARFGLRSWCRLRTGLLHLRHLNKCKSEAKIQKCIFCDTSVGHSLVHVIALCPHWRAWRLKLDFANSTSNQDFTLSVLRRNENLAHTETCLQWASELDKEAFRFWRR